VYFRPGAVNRQLTLRAGRGCIPFWHIANDVLAAFSVRYPVGSSAEPTSPSVRNRRSLAVGHGARSEVALL
jgi:hypothetical protein